MAKKTQEPTPRFRITFGQIKAAARITHSRDVLKANNYFMADSSPAGDYHAVSAVNHRLADGSGNDVTRPTMGQTERPFSRNAPAHAIRQRSWSEPDPRVVSQRLLYNPEQNQELGLGLNVLCAAWIQFQVHDWFNHKQSAEDALRLDPTGELPALELAATEVMGDMFDGAVPTYANTQGHWWDASQIYGANAEITQRLRAKDKTGLVKAELALDESPVGSLLPLGAPLPAHEVSANEVELSGFVQNWWLGLSALHLLFAHEHNSIVEKLRGSARFTHGRPRDSLPQAVEDFLFEKARLINAALIAKIHTVEWTPALLNDPVMRLGLYADWWGEGTENAAHLFDLFDRFAKSAGIDDDEELTSQHIDAIQAIPGLPEAVKEPLEVVRGVLCEAKIPNRVVRAHKEHNLDGTPLDYAISEEFVAVYRMHPLLRDPMPLRLADGGEQSVSLDEVSLSRTRGVMETLGLQQALHSLVSTPPGALRLRNYPQGLMHFKLPGSERQLDLGAVDIIRDRERGIPRYAAFKQAIGQYKGPLLHQGPVTPITCFADICGDPDEPGIDGAEQARRRRDIDLLASVYADVEDVDLLIGLLAEPLPPGAAFPWTSFEVFLLMAVFRLSVDRFYTDDYTPEVYTPIGMKWINDNGMREVLKRHVPKLTKDHLRDKDADGWPANPFLYESWF